MGGGQTEVGENIDADEQAGLRCLVDAAKKSMVNCRERLADTVPSRRLTPTSIRNALRSLLECSGILLQLQRATMRDKTDRIDETIDADAVGLAVAQTIEKLFWVRSYSQSPEPRIPAIAEIVAEKIRKASATTAVANAEDTLATRTDSGKAPQDSTTVAGGGVSADDKEAKDRPGENESPQPTCAGLSQADLLQQEGQAMIQVAKDMRELADLSSPDQLFIRGAVSIFLDQYPNATIEQLAQVAKVSNQTMRRYVADSEYLIREHRTVVTYAALKEGE